MTPDARAKMELLRGRVHRLQALIDGILEYSRAARAAKDREEVDVAALAREVVDLLPRREGAVVEIAEGLPRMRTERVPLQQVLMNLVGNALKHARRDDPRVRLTARDAGDRWELAVDDNGPGIAPRYHERIWGLFQTLEARDKVEGTGIGLSVVRKIVERKGGRAWVESAEGSGASFRFTWPKEEGDGR
jgi:signal transduction histidine kinase